MFRDAVDEHSELRLLEPHHADALFAAVDANREMLRQWLSWVDLAESPDDIRAFIDESLQKLARQQEVTAGIWHRGQVAGVLGARLSPLAPTAEIGYWLGAEFQGHGLMTRAVGALLQYLFEDRRLNRIEIHCAPDNIKSCGIPERLGFRQEGVLREAELVNGRFFDNKLFALLRRDWKDPQPPDERQS